MSLQAGHAENEVQDSQEAGQESFDGLRHAEEVGQKAAFGCDEDEAEGEGEVVE